MTIEIDSVGKLTDYQHLNFFKVLYKDRKKQRKKWIFASRSGLENPLDRDHKRPDAVVVVPFHIQEKKLVLIKEFRVALGGYQFGFPAGLLDDGETVEKAGGRELFEETGLTVIKILKQSPAVFSSSGMTDESVSLLFVQCDGIPTSRHNEDSEDIETVMVSKREAETLLCDNRIKFDVKSWIILNHFAAAGTL